MAVKKRDHEKLDDSSIETVMALREQAKPITIKEACERLNISVNGARLQKIFEEYRERQAEDKRRRAANRGKPASEYEISTIVEEYLSGESLKNIADQLYRSNDFVKRVIEEVGVPQAMPGDTYAQFSALPEQCLSDTFDKGELVWSSKYGAIAEVDFAWPNKDAMGSTVYRIYVHQRIDEQKMLVDGKTRYAYHVDKGGGFYASQAAHDLGSLRHLEKYKVNVRRAIK